MKIIRIAATSALACASGAVAVATAAPAAASRAADVAVTSSSPLPSTTAASALAGRAFAAAPAANTPDGFKLIHPGYRRSDHVYDSDKVYQGSYHCNDGNCTLRAEVTVQLHEYVIGNNSHTWQLTANMHEYKNPGHLRWSYFATYYCGVNIKGGNDHECNNGAAPSHVNMSVNDVVNKPWGKTNNITVFPMVAMSTQFSNGPRDTTKFRGYDTLSRARSTELATKSGNGN